MITLEIVTRQGIAILMKDNREVHRFNIDAMLPLFAQLDAFKQYAKKELNSEIEIITFLDV